MKEESVENQEPEIFIQGKYGKFWIEDGIACGEYQVEHVTLEIANEMVADRLSINGSKPRPLFADFRTVKKLEPDARHYLAHEGGAIYVNSCALLIKSNLSKMIGNFFLNINRPAVPFRIFTKAHLAKKWLKQFREE